jgi:ribosomal protein L34E
MIENFIRCPICEINLNGVANLRMHWRRSENNCKSGALRFGANLCQESTRRCVFDNEENGENVENHTEANTTILEDQA